MIKKEIAPSEVFFMVVSVMAKVVIYTYTILTLPIYWLLQNPGATLKRALTPKSVHLDPLDPNSPWVRRGSIPIHFVNDCLTADEVFTKAVQLYQKHKCLGYRRILSRQVATFAGKPMPVCSLSDYEWIDYIGVDEKVDNVMRAFLMIGVKPKDKVLIFAETRMEWILCAHALFRMGASVATLYPSLGDYGLAYAINELETTVAVTSSSLLPKLLRLHQRISKIEYIVYFDMNQAEGTLKDFIPDFVEVVAFSEFERKGRNAPQELNGTRPLPSDLAVLMYTSGSTGMPKGVMITHRNLITLMKNMVFMGNHLGPKDMYVGFLPLSHMAEISFESVMLSLGVPVGYATSTTLTDSSPGLMPGTRGDCTLLKPTMLHGVPLIMERIKKTIMEDVDVYGSLVKDLVNFALVYKKYWVTNGYSTPIVDRLICAKFNKIVGGKVRFMISGGSPLSEETEQFIRYGLGVKLMQGYGLTEVSCVATIMDPEDLHTGCVGYPAPGAKIRLVDWEEGGYLSTDRPNPRGEVVIGGEGITSGYFKRQVITSEVYRREKGVIWFYSGDIGEMLPNGALRIIDRKKDLVKLQHGEYVALGKVEAILKGCQYVDNICVHGNGLQTYIFALIVPNVKILELLAYKLQKENLTTDQLCRDVEVISFIAEIIVTFGEAAGLHKTEIPRKVTLCPEEWTPESGLVTAGLKVRRLEVYKAYKKQIQSMYD